MVGRSIWGLEWLVRNTNNPELDEAWKPVLNAFNADNSNQEMVYITNDHGQYQPAPMPIDLQTMKSWLAYSAIEIVKQFKDVQSMMPDAPSHSSMGGGSGAGNLPKPSRTRQPKSVPHGSSAKTIGKTRLHRWA